MTFTFRCPVYHRTAHLFRDLRSRRCSLRRPDGEDADMVVARPAVYTCRTGSANLCATGESFRSTPKMIPAGSGDRLPSRTSECPRIRWGSYGANDAPADGWGPPGFVSWLDRKVARRRLLRRLRQRPEDDNGVEIWQIFIFCFKEERMKL